MLVRPSVARSNNLPAVPTKCLYLESSPHPDFISMNHRIKPHILPQVHAIPCMLTTSAAVCVQSSETALDVSTLSCETWPGLVSCSYSSQPSADQTWLDVRAAHYSRICVISQHPALLFMRCFPIVFPIQCRCWVHSADCQQVKSLMSTSELLPADTSAEVSLFEGAHLAASHAAAGAEEAPRTAQCIAHVTSIQQCEVLEV